MKILITFLFLSLASSFSYAYPEMIRHGYSSCTTCHLSPNGGGLLTQYGRSLANELLTYKRTSQNEVKSTASDETAEVVEKWLKGGNARVLLFHRDNEYESSYVTIPMQLEAYGAYNTDQFAFVLGAAVAGQRSGNGGESGPAYGLNNSLHAVGTRAPIGFGYNDQRPTVEFSYLGEKWAFFLSQAAEKSPIRGKSASSAQIQLNPTENSKVAFNYWTESNIRSLYGFWFVMPIYEHFYLSADYNIQNETQFDTDGLFYFAKLSYEFVQGVQTYLMKDFSQRDKNLSFTKVDRYGLGFQIFPYLNWEVDAVWLKEKNLVSSQVEGDYAYIMVHCYL